MHKAAKAQLFSTGIAPLSDLILSSFATWASFRQTPAFAFATFLLSEFFTTITFLSNRSLGCNF
jgi:hypothetical protein